LSGDPICRRLEWDSAHFGVGIGRYLPRRLDGPSLHAAADWCRAEAVQCLYLLLDADPETVRAAEAWGGSFVDVRLTLERTTVESPSVPPVPSVRPHHDLDLPALKAIARQSHGGTRFYRDGRFSRASCDALYEIWIERSTRQAGGMVLVGGDPVSGYVTCERAAAGGGQIGLFAVASAQRGRGLGAALLAGAIEWFAAHDIGQIEVVTQGLDPRALRVYERAGFVTRSLELSYHLWFEDGGHK
jgi:GNAT superfamily N-acetyltransferase